MGVDTKITLPAHVRVDDVAVVLGIAAGLEHTRQSLSMSGSEVTRVNGASVATTSVPEMVNILLDASDVAMVDGEPHHRCSYFFEWDSAPVPAMMPGARGLYVRSTPFWIATATKVVDFFGGSIDYNDCDDRFVDYTAEGIVGPPPNDGAPWQAYQDAMAAVDPCTRLDLERAAQHAAYPMGVTP